MAAVNREISCLHHLLRKDKEWELLEGNPFDRGKSLVMKENNQRTRYLSQEEIQKLLDASPEHLKNIIICALNTGMRRSEIFGLKWGQVRNGFIYSQKTKTNEPRQIPINDTLAELFERLKSEIKKTDKADDENLRPRFVFTYKSNKPDKIKTVENTKIVSLVVDNDKKLENDKRLDNVKNSFSTAVKKSGIEHCTLHDLRHIFASHLLMNGASIKDVQELLGHKTMQMTLRYAHLSQEHKKKAVNLLNGLTAPQKEVLSHFVTDPILNPLEGDQSSANS
ncbi:MAG: tyrosine-type recombinase/integrase [Syntrophales bacterium]